ncbi:MAG: right-handed parallel beta-helix repeat-containing protein [Candidatus Heimdallarchaeota archaeon]|nr:MAG: right-handed parallel beta-helix repeat-containing protein [Candidatus Heimdallarchaeota archaeon]
MSKPKKVQFSVFLSLTLLMLVLSSLVIFSDNFTLDNTLGITDRVHTIREPFWDLTGTPIIIDDAFPDYSWDTTATLNQWCSGSGTWDDPFILENILMNGSEASRCITIRNSNVYFCIRNCKIENSIWNSFGIYLEDVANGTIQNNSFRNNNRVIVLGGCNNNTIGNNSFYNDETGISIWYSVNTTIEYNTIYDSGYAAISLSQNTNTTLYGNKMYECGIDLLPMNDFDTITIDTSNIINEKPVYYYVNEARLTTTNFTNAGQILLINCSKCLIFNTALSHSSEGIKLISSDNNIISNNVFSQNRRMGINLFGSNNNTISENSFYNEEDGEGIFVWMSDKNVIDRNNISIGIYGSGISIDSGNDTQISNNRIINIDPYDEIRNNWTQGVAIYGCTNTSITNNYVYKQGFGYSVEGSQNTSISENVGEFCNHGMYLQNANIARISGNKLLNCQDKCLSEENSTETIYQRNYCNTAIKILTPSPKEIFGQESPSFNLQVNLPNTPEILWYTMNNGETNITCGLSDIIDQIMWTTLPDGPVVIQFYAMDAAKNIGSGFIEVSKQTHSPTTTFGSYNSTYTTSKSSGFSLGYMVMVLFLLFVLGTKKKNHI